MAPRGDDEAKRIVLARRARFLAAALASVAATGAAAAGAEACGGGVDQTQDAGQPQPCLKVAPDSSQQDSGADTGVPQPCLSIAPDAEPQPCLGALPPDAGDGG